MLKIIVYIAVIFSVIMPSKAFAQEVPPASPIDEKLNRIVSRIENVKDEKTLNLIYQEYEAFKKTLMERELIEMSSKKIVESLTARQRSISKDLNINYSEKPWAELKAAKEELNKARQEALKTIFDLDIYPDHPPGSNAHIGQKIVDEKVNAVRKIYNSLAPKNELARTYLNTVNVLERISEWLGDFGWPSALILADEEKIKLIKAMQYFPGQKPKNQAEQQMTASITAKNFPLNAEEVDLMLNNQCIWQFNNSIKTTQTSNELEVVKLINEYREMLGLRILEVNDAVGIAAQKHSGAMAIAGTLWHVGSDGTPQERTANEGYPDCRGENCAMDSPSPESPFNGWYNSSGHHRTMMAGLNQIGIGQSGRFWTADFGGASLISTIADAKKLLEQLSNDNPEIWKPAAEELSKCGEAGTKAVYTGLFRKNIKTLDKYRALRRKKIETVLSDNNLRSKLEKKRQEAIKIISGYALDLKEQPKSVDNLVDEIRLLYFGDVDQVNKDPELLALIEEMRQVAKFISGSDGTESGGEKGPGAELVASMVAQAKEQVDRELLDEVLISKGNKDVLKKNEKFRDEILAGEFEVVLLTNEYRMMMGRNALLIDVKLVTAARKHSEDMKRLGLFSHTSPVKGKESFQQRAALEGTAAGSENIAQAPNAKGAFNGWFHSPGYHKNMLVIAGATIGVGQCEGLWTEMFN